MQHQQHLAQLEQQFHEYEAVKARNVAWLKERHVVTGADYWEAICDRYSTLACVEVVAVAPSTQHVVMSYSELDQHANRIGHWGLSIGLVQGDVVC
jgi:hypothetical protein